MEDIEKIVRTLKNGEITIKFQDGIIIFSKVTQNSKPNIKCNGVD